MHTLTMDTTAQDNAHMSRAINLSFLHHLFFGMIIFAEFVVALACWVGGFRLLRNLGAAVFNKAKGIAIAGLTLGFLLWFVVFFTIAAEWFLMWQSKLWNAQEPAFRLIVILGMVLIYLIQTDREEDA